MMEGINLYSIDYYKKTVFKGSYRGLCFRLFKAEVDPNGFSGAEGAGDDSMVGELSEDGLSGAGSAGGELSGGDSAGGELTGGGSEPITVLRAQAWKGPYVLEKTQEEIFTEDFEYTNDGLNAANEWLEEKQRIIIGG